MKYVNRTEQVDSQSHMNIERTLISLTKQIKATASDVEYGIKNISYIVVSNPVLHQLGIPVNLKLINSNCLIGFSGKPIVYCSLR